MGLWTKEEAVTIIREAHEAVTEAGVPDDLRLSAFNGAFNLLATKAQPQPVILDKRQLGLH